VTSVDRNDDKKGYVDVLDLDALSFDDLTEIDTGVTSGADSSDWDPISVDEDKKSDDCAGAGSETASSKSSPAACGVRQN
jgi:hypothetical protein